MTRGDKPYMGGERINSKAQRRLKLIHMAHVLEVRR